MPLLYLAQSIEGRVTREGLREVAALLGLTTAEVEAVATLLHDLRCAPTGGHVVSVCTNLVVRAPRREATVYEAAREAAGDRRTARSSPRTALHARTRRSAWARAKGARRCRSTSCTTTR